MSRHSAKCLLVAEENNKQRKGTDMKNKSLNLKTKELMKRAVSLITAVAMVITILPLQPITAYAAETGTTVCTHHIHSEECGYVAAVDEVPCTHQHDEGCGFAAAADEVLCECTETDENGAVLHTENCGYTPAVEEVPCTHTHDESCGYIAAVAGASCTWTAESCTECNPVNNSEAEPAANSTPDVPSEETEPAVGDEQDIKNGETEPIVECICETDDKTIHAANCPLYTPVENPQCFCGEKCTEETLNYWCDVCGVQGVAACQAAEEETAVVYSGYSYTDQHGTIHTVDNATEITEDSTTWSDGWYYVKDYVSIGERITVNGDVTLILGTTAHLEARKGIKVSGGNSLTIYGATADSGLLYAYSFLSSAAIGSDGNATIDDNGKIIISSDADTTLGTITINSGKVKAEAVADDTYSTAAAIGGGRYSKGGTININGGDVYAETPQGWGRYVPAIGPGELSSGDVMINITGGKVTAQADYVAIGCSTNAGCNLTLNISGGNIAAVSYVTETNLVTIGSGASSGSSKVNITGGTINAASIGSHLFKDVLTVSGGKFVQDPVASLPKGMYTVQGTDGLYTAHWGGAYIEGITQVESISVMVNGTAQTLASDDYKIVGSTLYIFVPNCVVLATVNGVNYICNHTSQSTKLEKYTEIDDLDISSNTINAGEPKEFTATVATLGAVAVKLEYKITDQGTTGAYISNGSTVCTDLDGVFKLTVTATDVFDQTYSETFDITSEIIAVTGISGDSAIPQSVNPSTLQLPTGVLPANASKTTVVWSVVSGSAVVSGNTARFIGAGTAVLRATVENGLGHGKDFTKDYAVTVSAPAGYNLEEGNIIFSKIDDSTMKIEYGAGNVTNVPMGTIVTITGNSKNTITVLSGVANFVLKDCAIGTGYSYPSDIIPVNISSGAKAEITLSGENELIGRPAIYVPQDARLIIDGTGELYVESMYGNASIGGKSGENAGSITINGGTVNAKNSHNGATIGGGEGGSGGSITINGGTVTAENSSYGAAIGGGSNGSGGSITINGGTVTAESKSIGAAIGGGNNGSAGSITINGGTVNAENSRSGAAIGGAGGTGSITINGGTVTATGGQYGAGIGGSKSSGGSITISGGTVTATGGQYGAGIGGSNGSGGNITISGGTVTATGVAYGAGIGGGNNGAGGNITISGGTVTATGAHLSAGIGGGYNGAGGDVVITGGNIKAVDLGGNFNIGAGSGSRDDGTLTDGTNSVSLCAITLDGAVSDTAVTNAVLPQGTSYGVIDVKTLDTNKLYFYLPANTAVNSITAGTAEYICNRNNTYYTAHGTTGYADIKETTHDVVCSLCGTVFIDNVNHQYGANDKCACGRDKHTHNWTYIADENTDTITAKCTDNGCPLTNADGGNVKITVADREYNGNAAEAVVTNTLTTGDTYTVTYTGTTFGGTAYNSATAPSQAGSYTAAIEIGSAKAEVAFRIEKKELTPSFKFFAPNPVTYNGTTELPIRMAIFENVIAGDNIGIIYNTPANFEDANVGENKTVYITGIYITGDDAANYTAKETYTTTWSIGPASITVIPKADQSKVYGTEDPVFEYKITGSWISGDTLTGKLGRISGADVGEYTYTIGTLENSNYDITIDTANKFVITQATPDVSSVTATIADNSTAVADIRFSGAKGVDGSALAGEFTVTNPESLVWGNNTVEFTFTPADANYTSVNGTVTITVKDTIVPTGEVKVEENSWTAFVNDITFGLLFNKTVDVTVTTADTLSGVKSVEYIESDEALTLDELKQIANWTAMDADNKVSVTAEDAKQFVYYIRITDNAGNVTIISSNGMVFDLKAPEISIENGKTYYTTQKFTVTEANLADVKVNDATVTDYTLAGNVDATYKVVVTDKAVNITTVTVTMKTIDSISESIKDLTESDVTGDNADIIKEAEETLATVDTTYATDAEKAEIAAAQANVDALQEVIKETAEEVKILEETVAGYDKDTVKSTDETAVDRLIDDLEEKLEDANLSTEQKTDLTEALADAHALAQQIDSDKAALEDANNSVPAVDTDNVTADNAEDLAAAKDKLEDLKADDNYTEAEKAEIQEEIDRIEALEKVIEQTGTSVDKTVEEEGYSDKTQADITSAEKDEIEANLEAVEELLDTDNLTEEQRKALEDTKTEAENLLAEIKENSEALDNALEAEKDTTEDNYQLSDKEDLKEAVEKLKSVTDESNKNYTAEEKQTAQAEINRVESIIADIEETETVIVDITNAVEKVVAITDVKAIPDSEEAVDAVIAAQDDYDNLTDRQKELVGDTLKQNINDALAKITAYEIIHGAYGKWTIGASQTLGFTANGLFKLFKEVKVDRDVLVKDTDYTAQSGSTIVTLNKEYLDTLSVGKHKLEVVYDVLGTEHIADCEFTVNARPVESTSDTTTTPTDNVPKTGDTTNTLGWLAVMLSSMAAFAVVLKKKKEYEDK